MRIFKMQECKILFIKKQKRRDAFDNICYAKLLMIRKVTQFSMLQKGQSKNSDQTRSSDQPDQTCNHRTLRNTQPILFKLGSNLADEMFISKNSKENFKIF